MTKCESGRGEGFLQKLDHHRKFQHSPFCHQASERAILPQYNSLMDLFNNIITCSEKLSILKLLFCKK